MRLPLLAFVVIALASGRAAADDATPFESKPTAIYAVLGVGTPVGFIGAELEQTLAPYLSASGGLGWGLSGPQAAAMLHFLAGGQRSKLTLGAGVSGGKYSWTEFCIDCGELGTKAGTVGWGNVEIGGEHRFWNGFALRYFGGYGRIIAGDLVCDPSTGNCGTYHQDDGREIVYTGLALGGAF